MFFGRLGRKPYARNTQNRDESESAHETLQSENSDALPARPPAPRC